MGPLGGGGQIFTLEDIEINLYISYRFWGEFDICLTTLHIK